MRSELASRASVARAREEGERVRGSRGRAGSRRWDPWSRVASRPRRRGKQHSQSSCPFSLKMSQLLWLAGFRTPSDCPRSAGICCQEKRDLGPLNSDETGNPDDQLGNERGGWRGERSWSGRDTAPSRRDGSRSGRTLGEARQGGRGRQGRGRGPSRAKEGGARTFVGEGEREGKGRRARKGRVVDLVQEAGGQEREASGAPASRAMAEDRPADPRREPGSERPGHPRDDVQVLPREADDRRDSGYEIEL